MEALKQVINIKNENGFEYMTTKEIHQEKQYFIDNYMEGYKWEAKNSTEASNNFNKEVEMRLRPANKEASRTIYSIWNTKKRLFRGNWDDFISAAIVGMFYGMRSFNPKKDKFNWLKLNELGSKENIEAHKYVSTAMTRDVEKYATFLAGKQRTTVSGKLTFRKLDGLYESSMDQEYVSEDGEEMTLHDITPTEANILFTRDDSNYSPEHFLKWFWDNIGELETTEDGELKRDDKGKAIFKTKGILSLVQLEFYTIVKHFSKVVDPNPNKPNTQELGIWSDSEHPYEYMKTKYNRNQGKYMPNAIAMVVEKAYKEAFPNGEPRVRNEKSITDGIELFKGFMDCVDNSEVVFLNQDVSNWIRNNWHETKVHHLIGDNFTDKEQYDINGCIMNGAVKIPNELIGKFIILAENKLEELKNWDNVPRKTIKLKTAKEIAEAEEKSKAKMIKQNEKQGYLNLTTSVYGFEVDHDFETYGEAEFVAGTL